MTVNGFNRKNMDMELIIGMEEEFTKVNGRMIKWMDKVILLEKMVSLMKGFGRITRWFMLKNENFIFIKFKFIKIYKQICRV